MKSQKVININDLILNIRRTSNIKTFTKVMDKRESRSNVKIKIKKQFTEED